MDILQKVDILHQSSSKYRILLKLIFFEISKEYGYFGTMWIFSINVDFFRADIRRHESQFICTELTKSGTENKTREIKREIIQI